MSQLRFSENLQQSLSQSLRHRHRSSNKRRVEYAGGYKMRDPHTPKTNETLTASHLDKDLIYSKLGFNFSDETPIQSQVQSDSFLVTTTKREYHNCKFAPKYQCYRHDGTMKITKADIEVPQVQRTKEQYEVEGDVICYYYQPNHAENANSIVVINSSKVHKGHEEHNANLHHEVESNKIPTRQPQTLGRQTGVSKQKINKVVSNPQKKHEPSPTQVLEYKQKYKQYISNKRDRHFAILLRKLIEKIDFQRFQCTSPNEQRIKAEWKGKFRPRVLVTMAGLVSYYKQSSEGIDQLKKFIYLFLCRGAYNLKEPYQVTANTFIDEFEKYLNQKKDYQRNPEKALNKLNFRKVHELLKQTINTSSLVELFDKMRFLSVIFDGYSIGSISSEKKPKIDYHQFESLFILPKRITTIQQPQKTALIPKPATKQTKSVQQHLLFKTDEQIDKMHLKVIPQGILSSDNQPKIMTIRQYKLQDDLSRMKLEEDEMIHYKFKAKDIPKAVADKSRYKELLIKQDERRKRNKLQSQTRLKESEKPFSFYGKEQHERISPEKYYHWDRNFTARSVPNIVKKNIYNDMIQEQEDQRNLKMKARQYELMSMSHYPQSMRNLQNYKSTHLEKLQADRQRLYGTLNTNLSFYKQIPDFQSLHRQNNISLERIKMNNRTTNPQQFNFSVVKQRNDFVPTSPKKFSLSRVLSASGMKPTSVRQVPQYISPSTLKFDAYVNKRRSYERERESIKASREMKKDSKYYEHKRQIIQRMEESLPPKITKDRHKQEKNESWSDKKNLIIKKVYEDQPLLIERSYARQGGKKVEKIVKPLQVSDKFDTIL